MVRDNRDFWKTIYERLLISAHGNPPIAVANAVQQIRTPQDAYRAALFTLAEIIRPIIEMQNAATINIITQQPQAIVPRKVVRAQDMLNDVMQAIDKVILDTRSAIEADNSEEK